MAPTPFKINLKKTWKRHVVKGLVKLVEYSFVKESFYSIIFHLYIFNQFPAEYKLKYTDV